jgi:hypothetical protein
MFITLIKLRAREHQSLFPSVMIVALPIIPTGGRTWWRTRGERFFYRLNGSIRRNVSSRIM